MSKESRIFCIIPAYNEEKSIGEVLKSLNRFGYRAVVVDDGSRDRTAAIARENGADVLSHLVNRGQGAALETGNSFALALGAYILVHFDADGQFLAEEIKDLVRPIIDGEADAVFGSRFLGKKSEMPWFKENFIFPLAGFINRAVFGIRMTDPQSGFRALSREAASNIHIENDKMAHCSEILIKVFRRGYRVKEVPITVIYNEFGQRLGGGFKILKDLFISRLMN